MKKGFDPNIIFIIIGVVILSRVIGAPVFFLGIAAYFIYQANKGKRDRNNPSGPRDRRDRSERYDRRERSRNYERPTARNTRPETRNSRRRPARNKPQPIKNNPFKTSGINKYKDYDYNGAIEDFEKALEINEKDLAVHFNIACAYSLTEQKDKSLYHLSRAVELGFTDFEKIKTHDALAYLRIQDEYEAFVQNGYKWKPDGSTIVEQKVEENSTLLDQLKQLADLREKGLLTEQEFEMQKKKLLK